MPVLQRARDRQDEDVSCAGLCEGARARGNGRSRSKDIVNEQDALSFNQARSLDLKGCLNALAPPARVHPCAMALRVNPSDETPFIQREPR